MSGVSVSGPMGRDVPEAGSVDAPARGRVAVSAKRLGVAALVAVLCAGTGWYGYGWWTVGRFIETTDDAYVGGEVTTISPHVAGFVTDILVADNEHVQAGQLLARLDRRDYQAALDHAQAAMEAQNAALAGLRAQALQQQSVIVQSSADLDAKTARAAFTRIDGTRYATLAVTSAGTRQEAERSRAADQEAQAATAASHAGLQAARQQLKVLENRIAEAQAGIGQARADLQRALLDMGYTEIRAPIEGYIGNRAAHVGAFVGVGSYLLSVIPAHGLWVDANFKEDQLARMVPGQAATLVADAAPGLVLHGQVVSLAPGTGAVFSVIPPENATGNFTKIVQRVPVRIALDTTGATLNRLRPGLSTTVSVDTRPAP
jgi:membrane fusion protein (multidrug efflux system)